MKFPLEFPNNSLLIPSDNHETFIDHLSVYSH